MHKLLSRCTWANRALKGCLSREKGSAPKATPPANMDFPLARVDREQLKVATTDQIVKAWLKNEWMAIQTNASIHKNKHHLFIRAPAQLPRIKVTFPRLGLTKCYLRNAGIFCAATGKLAGILCFSTQGTFLWADSHQQFCAQSDGDSVDHKQKKKTSH